MESPFPPRDSLWISAPWQGGPRTQTCVPYLRKSFVVTGPVVSATLHLTAFGLYEAELNGRRVGDEVFAPGWTDYHKRVQFQSHDVASLLQPGENVLGALLGDGWYCGYMAWEGRQAYGEKPWLLACLRVRLADGSELVVTSDASWKVRRGPLLEADLLMGESYDARQEIGAWSSPGYDDSAWLPVVAGPSPHPQSLLVPRAGPPVKRIEEVAAVTVKNFPDGANSKGVLIDFGQNLSGRARIRVRSARGRCLRIRFGEALDANGNLYVDNLRGARVTDYYTCKGDESETWEPRFTFHGFRYLDVIGLAEDDEFEATAIVLHSEMAVTGEFRCSNPLLNQLQSNIRWGQRSNFLEVPTDCPQRDERLGWTGDAQVFASTAAFNMDVRRFFAKWLQDMRDAQRPSGAIPLVVPMPVEFRHLPFEDAGPAWSDACVICPWTIYVCYGDTGVLKDHYETMRAYVDYLGRERCLGHIRCHPEADSWGGFGDWLALDGSGRLEGGTPKDLIGTALYANDAALMARIASVLGHADDVAFYAKLHADIVKAFRLRFLTPEGLVAAGTQTAYVLALHFGLVPAHAAAACARELVRLIERNGNHIATGFVGTPYILDVLARHGHLDVAYKLLEQDTFPSWIFPIKNGATTIWERWNGWTPEGGFQDKSMNSFNHYAYGAVGAWMYESVAGLAPDPAQPGYRHIVFRPRPGGGITWAEASLETAHGRVSIRWDRGPEELRVRLTVPSGTRATFHPPEGYAGETLTLDPGIQEFTLPKGSRPPASTAPASTGDEPRPVGV